MLNFIQKKVYTDKFISEIMLLQSDLLLKKISSDEAFLRLGKLSETFVEVVKKDIVEQAEKAERELNETKKKMEAEAAIKKTQYEQMRKKQEESANNQTKLKDDELKDLFAKFIEKLNERNLHIEIIEKQCNNPDIKFRNICDEFFSYWL